ncbi:MAG: sugar transferase, partial [Alphaproteobacteria bacterium]
MIRWTHGLINRLVICCDIVMLTDSGIIMWLIADDLRLPGVTLLQLALFTALGVLIFVKVLEAGGSYRVEQYQTAGRQLRQIVIGGVPAAIAVAVAFWAYIPEPQHHLTFLLAWAAMALALVSFGRFVLVRIGMRLAAERAVLRRNVAIVGTVPKITEILEQLDRSPDRLYDVVGIYLDEGEPEGITEIAGTVVRGSVQKLYTAVHSERIDVILLALPWESTARINKMIESVHRIAADVVVPLDRNTFNPRFAQFASVGGLPSLRVMYQPLKGSLGVLKMVEDYVVATIALIVVAPILAVAAVLIKLDSSGP